MEITQYGINEALARSAKEANSFRGYTENAATDTYTDLLSQFKRAVEELIELNKRKPYPASDEQIELVEYYSDKYAAKLAAAINRENNIEASCPSIMITGAGNFPVRKKERQNAAREKFWSECGELFEPTDNYYYRKIRAILTNTAIYSDDALAIEKLQCKLQDLEERHAKMKAYNAYYRKNKTMKGFEGMSDETAEKIDTAVKDGFYNAPIAPYQLTNSNAEIKRIKNRIASLEKLKANAEKPVEDKYPKVDGVEVVENAEAMRVQLVFDGKPDDKTRDLLKSNGFRWSPRFGAWQRQLTANGIYATKRVLEKLQ